jgi:intracellular multiplication protein IcmO
MAKRGFYRGLGRDHEIDPRRAQRDTRLAEKKLHDVIGQPRTVSVILVIGYAIAFMFPLMMFVLFPVVGIMGVIAWNNHADRVLPLRLPREARAKKDYNSPGPAGTFKKPDGQFYLGVEKRTGRQLWETTGDILQHKMVVGSTGSGKTVGLIAMVANMLAMGSGAFYSDAKATRDLAWKIYTLARMFGRDDDFLVESFITGTYKIKKADPARLTNTDNPCAIGTADSLLQLLSSLMSESGDANQIFRDRALAAMSAMLYALVELRDDGHILLSIATIRDSLSLRTFIETRHDERLSDRTRSGLHGYLESALPGYDDTKDAAGQPAEVAKQHGFAEGYFTRAVASLMDTYGHIFLTEMGEIDREDMVLNNRIVVAMLPALEKSTSELEMIGRLNYAATRDALRIGLGKYMEGSRQEVLENLPTASDVPQIMIFDELAYQMVDGMAVTAAQARGLGIAMVFAMQDFAGPQKANEKEFQQIVGNTRTKSVMVTEDPEATWNQIKTIAGEGVTSEVDRLEQRGRAVFDDYKDQASATYQRRARIDLMDLRAQVEGEAHLLHGDKIVRYDTFAVEEVKTCDFYYVNRFLCVGDPIETDYPEVEERLSEWIAGLNGSRDNLPGIDADLVAAHTAYESNADEGPIIPSIAALMTFHNQAREQDSRGMAQAMPDEASAPTQPEAGPAQPAQAGENTPEIEVPAEPPMFDPDSEQAEQTRERQVTEERERVDKAGFIARALDKTNAGYVFAYNDEKDLDYDIASSIAGIEKAMVESAEDAGYDEAEVDRYTQSIGEQIQSEMLDKMRYPTPPEPRATEDMHASVTASIDRLLANKAGGEAKRAEPVTAGADDDPDNDL